MNIRNIDEWDWLVLSLAVSVLAFGILLTVVYSNLAFFIFAAVSAFLMSVTVVYDL